METKPDLELALAAGAAQGNPKEADGAYAVVPKDHKVVDLERLQKAPAHQRGTALFTTEDSFCRYVTRFKTDDSLTFADGDKFSVTTVFDYHKPHEAPDWGQHRACLQLPLDPDWKVWNEHNDRPMKQIEFAQFVEDNLPVIQEPDGATLLELVQDLEAKTNVAFRGAERLHDGSRAIKYEETTQQKVGKGQVELPESFELRLKVFRWGGPYDLTAKLRYRIAEGALFLMYHLHRPEDTSDKAFADVLEAINVETQITPLKGKAPSVDEIRRGATFLGAGS